MAAHAGGPSLGMVIVVGLLLLIIAFVAVRILAPNPPKPPKPKADPALRPQRPPNCPPAMQPVSHRYGVKEGKCVACDDYNDPKQDCPYTSLATCLEHAAPSGVLGSCKSDTTGNVIVNNCSMQPESNLAVYPQVDGPSCNCVFRKEYCTKKPCGSKPDFGECIQNTDCQSMRCNNATRVRYSTDKKAAIHLCEPFSE